MKVACLRFVLFVRVKSFRLKNKTALMPSFILLLVCVMHNRLYKYLIKNNISYCKQFGFQRGHSTDHAVVQLVDQIIEYFENNKYTLGVVF